MFPDDDWILVESYNIKMFIFEVTVVLYFIKILSGSRNFYRLRMTSLTYVNECFHDFMFVNRAPLARFGKFSSTARWKALQSLYCIIRRLFVLFVAYSRTIRTIRRLFADYSYYLSTIRGPFVLFVDYSRTIRTIRRLFADYSYYSSTIRFTILVLSLAIQQATSCKYVNHSSPKIRVEIFTLAHGARACIESTQFIICHNNKLSRLDACPS